MPQSDTAGGDRQLQPVVYIRPGRCTECGSPARCVRCHAFFEIESRGTDDIYIISVRIHRDSQVAAGDGEVVGDVAQRSGVGDLYIKFNEVEWNAGGPVHSAVIVKNILTARRDVRKRKCQRIADL